jgi:hypothetical protein
MQRMFLTPINERIQRDGRTRRRRGRSRPSSPRGAVGARNGGYPFRDRWLPTLRLTYATERGLSSDGRWGDFRCLNTVIASA